MALLRYHTALVTGKVSLFGIRSKVHLTNNFGKNLVDVGLALRAALDERAVPYLCKGLRTKKERWEKISAKEQRLQILPLLEFVQFVQLIFPTKLYSFQH